MYPHRRDVDGVVVRVIAFHQSNPALIPAWWQLRLGCFSPTVACHTRRAHALDSFTHRLLFPHACDSKVSPLQAIAHIAPRVFSGYSGLPPPWKTLFLYSNSTWIGDLHDKQAGPNVASSLNIEIMFSLFIF